MRCIVKTVVIIIIMPILIVGLTCLDTSANQNVPFKPRAFLKDSILTPGEFHYLNITLDFESENIYIVVYSGNILPESEVCSAKNYYRWEYNQGVWRDASGYDSTYIDSDKCDKINNTYSFYISLSKNVNPGIWTIKIFVDNKEVLSNSLNVVIGDFCLFFSTIVGVFQPCIKDRHFLVEKDLICSDQEKKMVVSEKNIDENVDQVLNRQANSQNDRTTTNKKFYLSILNEKPLDKQELVKSNVFTYPRSKLKLIENNGVGSFFFDKMWNDLSGFCKNFLVIILVIFLILSCVLPIIISPANEMGTSDITIINVRSYPAVGDEWAVMFTTVGIANLIITAINGTTWADNNNSYDLRFLELKRDNESLNYEWINNSIFISNFSADETCFEFSKVLTPGVHTLMFRFGDDVAYAFNDAIINTSVDDISPYTVVYTPYNITATSNSSLDNVTLWYRWSEYNSSWEGASWVNDSVDSNSSDVDSSADKGTETDFNNVQATSRDSNVMTVQEAQTNDLTDHKDAVDSNSCDVDSSADKGTESNFVNCQATTRDSNVMTIQESDYGTPAVNENKNVDGVTSDYTTWETSGTSPWLNADDATNIVTGATNGQQRGWFSFANTTNTGSGFTVVLYVDFDAGDGNDDCDAVLDWNNDGVADATYRFNNPTTAVMNTGTISGLDTQDEINSARLRLDYVKSGSAGTMTVDHAYLNVQRAVAPNYCIDFEYQWTSAINIDDNEQLCMYITARTGTETLNINYRNGGSWNPLGSVTGTGWVNVTATGLESSTYTIQLKGNTETGDSSQGSWSIDCMFLHTWNSTNNYQIDFEYQWTSAAFGRQVETLCMYFAGHTGSETLNVNYRNGSSWTSLGTVTATGWKNVTATGLTSSTYTIQLIGTTESGDTTQDTWTVDCIFLQCCNDVVGSGFNWTIWDNSSNPDTASPWSWEFDFPNSTGYYEFYSIGKLSGYADETAPDVADAICYYENAPPVIELIYPGNGSSNINLQPNCQINANDYGDTLTVYWYENTTESWVLRQTNNDVVSNSEVDWTYTQANSFSTTYWWKVAVNDGISNVSAVYHFSTGFLITFVNTISPYVIKSSPLNITATGDSGLDNVTLWYRYSADNSSWGIKNTVDSNTCDVDSSPDKGTESNFANCQATTRDSNVMTIQESDYGTPAVNENKNVDGVTSDYTTWGTSGASPWLNADDATNIVTGATNGQQRGWFSFANTTNTGSGFTVVLYVDFDAGDGDDDCDWYIDWTDDGTADASGTFTDPTTAVMNTGTINGLDTQDEINSARLRLDYVKSGSPGTMTVDHAYLNVQRAAAPNYCIDFEYNWTTADYNDTDKTITIYVAGHTGSETLNVKYRNGASWVSLGIITATGWNNFTATGLTSEYYTIQLIGATEAGDASQDTWTIDCMFLFTNWSIWLDASNPDTGSPWGWSFDFPNGTGYYEFYSIGKKAGNADETAPDVADAICYYNPPPTIKSYNLMNSTGSKLNDITGLLDVNKEFYFLINVTDLSGWIDIKYINITAWYDNGSESTTYNQTLGGNLNMYLQYQNTTGTSQFKMIWPDDEVQLILVNCTDMVINKTTHSIKISFKPKSQVRWASSNDTWNVTPNTFNDPYSWNFNITVTDTISKTSTNDEYGVYKFSSILPEQDWVGIFASPGFSDISNVVTITYSSNYDFNMSIYFEENLTNVSSGYDIPITNNVYILANADLNDDITENILFMGVGEAYAVDIYNESGMFNENGVSQTVNVQFEVYIPFGTFSGKYTARVNTNIKHD